MLDLLELPLWQGMQAQTLEEAGPIELVQLAWLYMPSHVDAKHALRTCAWYT